jgi:simple sugar transport system substrate-binding protein
VEKLNYRGPKGLPERRARNHQLTSIWQRHQHWEETYMRSFKTLMAATAVIAMSATAALSANIAVVGGKSDDLFFNKIKKGMDDACLAVTANGGKCTYLQLQTYDNIGADAAQLVRTAISQGVDGIVVPNWVPDAEDPAIKEAMEKGIKIILMNAGGSDKAKELGALNYVGNEEYPAGLAAGEYYAAKGVKNIICVNTVPGAGNLEDRCRGVMDGAAKAGSKSVQLPLPASSFGDPTAVAEAIKATLLKDETIDGVITISAGDADSAASALNKRAKPAKPCSLPSTSTSLAWTASRPARRALPSTSSPTCRETSPQTFSPTISTSATCCQPSRFSPDLASLTSRTSTQR